MPDRPFHPALLAAGLVATALAAVAVDAFVIEPRWVQVTHHELPLPGLPAAWAGARIVHLTDLHYGNPHSQSLFAWMVRTVNGLEPDLVVVTGDYVVERSAEIQACAFHLGQLSSRHGVVGVLGDHDYTGRAKGTPRRQLDGVVEALEAGGVHLLRDVGVELAGGLRVAGTDPLTGRLQAGSLEQTLERMPEPHLLLSHSPEIIVAASRRDLPMVLCGHTHGGQVVIPFYGPPLTYIKLPRRYASGWSSMGSTRMYTCRGLSTHKSVRFCCRPEIAVFRLVASPRKEGVR